jgi:hypothetical protein
VTVAAAAAAVVVVAAAAAAAVAAETVTIRVGTLARTSLAAIALAFGIYGLGVGFRI